MAAMAPERSRTLHNFSLPPRLNWGTQKLLRCAKLNNNENNNNNPTSSSNDTVSIKRRTSTHQNAAFRSPQPPQQQPPPPPSSSSIRDENNEIEVITEKLMFDFRSQVDKFRATFRNNSDFAPPPLPESRPWNLRTRRSPATVEIPSPEVGFSGGERSKFSVSISRQEVEDDFIEMIGRRPPRKPKKRPRYIQKQLDTLFPGLWLSEITADMYKVNNNSEPSK
ncbi:uncharacterized protein LOC104902410 [Beta vulgaris subsp. vulgaris]|uniref:uncharacterized protein LOC104902410 n=1 Tax=Beta vulgaris subsp. vulgaris TaxID=3555 RepID=UPI002036C9E3|nr:uncharacterized protein LOC104902410 [Beta vulgaris subsp. vulgaris]